ncbi:uncharacterized protein (DUF2267 family) [Crossiella equi]|uniref:Uncharacterized protein (DUF2267 family) n=1 Tax=Crossiella equi TaxID=130796 RepID=A0ABS5AQJ5_9PSEU|nr:DUF2267 domain-containing protein [Crossiella equi]MBP2478837.1 uncharacterized protein (DUF2267 family) [Crossiella equi]
MTTKSGVFDHALQTANTWVRDVAEAFPTSDRRFAYRVLRAWLHALRDRLTVELGAHFAAQLPELVRGIYYDGWNPVRVPEKSGAGEYANRFAREADISDRDVPTAMAAVEAALRRHLSAGLLDKVFDQLPPDIRRLLRADP